eukprot:5077598-Pleurochrysis_carterae.AAC.3
MRNFLKLARIRIIERDLQRQRVRASAYLSMIQIDQHTKYTCWSDADALKRKKENFKRVGLFLRASANATTTLPSIQRPAHSARKTFTIQLIIVHPTVKLQAIEELSGFLERSTSSFGAYPSMLPALTAPRSGRECGGPPKRCDTSLQTKARFGGTKYGLTHAQTRISAQTAAKTEIGKAKVRWRLAKAWQRAYVLGAN